MKEKKEKRSWRHIETLMITSSVPLERFRLNESNDTNGDWSGPHQQLKGK
jgi:hypothetical protein